MEEGPARGCRWALLRNSGLKHDGPFPLQHQAARTVSAVPGFEKRFMWAMRIWVATVRVSGADALAECLEVPHLRLDPASDMGYGPALSERPTVVPGGAQGYVPGDCRRRIFFQWPAVLAHRDDRNGMTVDNGGMAAAGVIGAGSSDRADVFAVGDLVQQVWQDRTVAIAAGGELHRADVRRGGVLGQRSTLRHWRRP